MKKIHTLFWLVVLSPGKLLAQGPEVLIINGDQLVRVKEKARQKDKATLTLIDSLQKKANTLLAMKPVSVMDKTTIPVSGNKHDYMSQAPYFWYDSTKPAGLPYMRKDGVRNPEIYKISDRRYLGELEIASKTLALAWWLTGQQEYATKASTLLKHWFLNEATRMNPHLEYGQAIPGINNGRGIGIIETRALIGIADAALLLEGSGSWTKADAGSLKKWYEQYLDWLLTSNHGRDEHAAKNNHGTWYYAQAIDFALFTGKKKIARALAEESKRRLDSQLTSDGRQPLELARTNGMGYSTMNLRGWFEVATLAEKTGVDLWNYQTMEGSGLQKALQWLTPYATGAKPWTHQQIGSYSRGDIYILLLDATRKYKQPLYRAHIDKLDTEINDVLIDLLHK